MIVIANFTRKAIKDTFIRLIEERPLNEVTIKDIVEECGINRNSFYYHFQDLPSLLEEIMREEADAIIRRYPSVHSIIECYDAMIEFTSNRKRAILHIYRSISRDVFEQRLMEISEYFVKSYINTALSEEKINDEDKEAIINYYKCVCFGLIINWLNIGMKEEYAQSIRRIFKVKQNTALEIAMMLKDQL